jgi:hypothetical protein
MNFWTKLNFLFFGVGAVLMTACTEKEGVERSVYHWETNFDLTAEENLFLESNKIERIYAKYFDLKVLPSNEIGPVASINFVHPPKQEIIPVVYITTDVFTTIDSTEIEDLAEKTYTKIKKLHPVAEINEIQIDCDWMESIRDKYFYFLEELKEKMGDAELSVTVRLYQYKYPNLAGVPPVDRAVLMYYNMGEFRSYQETNSILNNEIGQQYLGFGEYPLPLDFALPNFSWALVFRYGQFNYISTSITSKLLGDSTLFNKTDNGYFIVQRDTVIGNDLLRYGDEIRLETCSEDDLIKAAELLKKEKNKTNNRLIIYDLKPNLYHENDKISRVFTAFN